MISQTENMPKTRSNQRYKQSESKRRKSQDLISRLIEVSPKLALQIFCFLTWNDIEKCKNAFTEWKSFIKNHQDVLDNKIFVQSWMNFEGHSKGKMKSRYKSLVEKNIVFWKIFKDGNLIVNQAEPSDEGQLKLIQKGEISLIMDVVSRDCSNPRDINIWINDEYIMFYELYEARIWLFDRKDMKKVKVVKFPIGESIKGSPELVNMEEIILPYSHFMLQMNFDLACWSKVKLPNPSHRCPAVDDYGQIFGKYLVSACDHGFVNVTDLITRANKTFDVSDIFMEGQIYNFRENFIFQCENNKVSVLWPLERTNDFSILVTLHNIDNDQLVWSHIFQCDGFFKHEVTFTDNFVIITRHVERQLRVIIYDLKTEILGEVFVPNMYKAVPMSVYILRDQILLIVASDKDDVEDHECSLFILNLTDEMATLMTKVPDVKINLGGISIYDRNGQGALHIHQDQTGFVYQNYGDGKLVDYSITNSFIDFFEQ